MSDTTVELLDRIGAEKQAQKTAFISIGQDMTNVPFEQYHTYIKAETEGPHEVRFFDFDGTLLKTQRVQTGQNAIFPSPPVHDHLEFTGWTHTQEEISNIKYRPSERGDTFMPGHIDVSAVYRCINNVTNIWVKPNNGGGKAVTLYFSKVSVNVVVNIDWGDGTDVDRVTVSTAISKAHTYTIMGEKHILIWSDNDDVYALGNGTTNTQIVTAGNTLVEKIYIADNVLLKPYACYNFTNMFSILLPQPGINSELPNYAFNGASELQHVAIPRGYTIFPGYFVMGCTGLASIVIPFTVTTLGVSGLNLTPRLERAVLPFGISELPNDFLNNGSTKQLVSDIINVIGLNAFNSYYMLTHINLAKKIDVAGGSALNSIFSLILNDLELNLKATTNVLTWGQLVTGTLSIRSDSGVAVCPGINNFNNIRKLIIGDFTSIAGPITNKSCEIYVFEGSTPPTITGSYISGLSKTATVYVPDESVTAYKTATNWTGIAGYIQPMSSLPV